MAKGSASDEQMSEKPPDIIIELNVEEGDTLEKLAETYQIPFEKLLAANEGRKRVVAGGKLRFAMPLPYTREALKELLTPTKEMITDAVKARVRAERAAGKKEVFLAEPLPVTAPPGQYSTALATAKYLGSIGLKVALFGGVLVAFLVLSRRSKEKADKRASELFMQEELSRTGAGPGPVSGAESGGPDESVPRRERRWQANRGGEATTSSAAPAQDRRPVNGTAAANGDGGNADFSEEDPAWLRLPAIHYALMQGNQQPCFRLATGEHDTRHWLAWEEPEDLRRMLKCMIANGFLSREMAVKVVAMEPYEYLQTAELNQRPVGFIPAGTRLEEDWHDEKLMGALTQVCQILPRHPADAPSSAPAILARWRQRAGLSVSSEAGPRNAAWEVRSSVDEEDSAGAPDEGRFIETTATSSESLEGHSVQQQSMQQPPLGDKSDVTASSAAGESTSARNTSVWQRLRGIGKQDKKKQPAQGATPKDAPADGQLNAGRIMERNRTRTSGQDFSKHLFGAGPGSARGTVLGTDKPDQAAGKGEAASAASSEPQTQPGRSQQYAELMTAEQQEEANAHLAQVNNHNMPADHSSEQHGSSGDGTRGITVQPLVGEKNSSGSQAGAAGAPPGDWYSQARQGQSLRDVIAAEAAKLETDIKRGESKGWWKQLKVVHTPARDFADGSFGFLTTRAIEEGRRPRIIAFESRGDAQEVQWLWDSWPEAGEGSNRTIPMRPDQLVDIAEHEKYDVTVFRRKQLPVRPGLSEQDLGVMLQAYSAVAS